MLTPKQKQILEFIKKYFKKNNYSPTQQETAKYFKLAKSTVNQHIKELEEKGYLEKINYKARAINIFEKGKLVSIPLLGMVSAGQQVEMFEQRGESIAIPKTKIKPNTDYFALEVRGVSMIEKNIHNGDIVLIKQQNTAKNGDNVVALIDNQETTLKTFYKEKDYIRLQPANKNLQPIIIEKDRNFSIQGVVVDVIKNSQQPSIEILSNNNYVSKQKLPINKILCGDCVDILKNIPDNSVDIIITSPPYDEVRKYNGFSYNLHNTGKELFRVLKNGGIVAMVIQDQTKNFAKSLTSFRTIVDWVDNIGFKLFETVIYRKYGTEGAWWKYRFRVDHEYMPIFLKGERPAYFNKEPLKIPSKHGGKVMTGSGNRRTDGKTTKTVTRAINAMKCRGTVWEYLNAGDKNKLKRKHPAVFPDKIPLDFIQCFCPPGGIVLDPFIGSGSSAVAAKKLNRNYIGIDISKEYCDLTEERLKAVE